MDLLNTPFYMLYYLWCFCIIKVLYTTGWGTHFFLFIFAIVLYLQDLLEAVLPFDILLDRRKRINFLNNLGKCSKTQKKPQVVRDAGLALASLVLCEEALERELLISTSYVVLSLLLVVSESECLPFYLLQCVQEQLWSILLLTLFSVFCLQLCSRNGSNSI